MTNNEKAEYLRTLRTHRGWKVLERTIRQNIRTIEEYILKDNYLDTGDAELSEASYLRARIELAVWKELLDMPERLEHDFENKLGEDLEVYDE